jgi:hypothetical protein
MVEYRKWWGNRHPMPVPAAFTMQHDWTSLDEIERMAWRNKMWRKRNVGSWQIVVNWLQ